MTDTPAPAPAPVDINKRIGQYIQVRDAIKAFDEKIAAQRKPLTDILEALGGVIQQFLDANKLKNLKTDNGSCYLSTRYTATVADPDAFINYVIANKKFELLERRANATAVRDFVETHGNLPAGVNLNGLVSVGVRRPSGSSE